MDWRIDACAYTSLSIFATCGKNCKDSSYMSFRSVRLFKWCKEYVWACHAWFSTSSWLPQGQGPVKHTGGSPTYRTATLCTLVWDETSVTWRLCLPHEFKVYKCLWNSSRLWNRNKCKIVQYDYDIFFETRSHPRSFGMSFALQQLWPYQRFLGTFTTTAYFQTCWSYAWFLPWPSSKALTRGVKIPPCWPSLFFTLWVPGKAGVFFQWALERAGKDVAIVHQTIAPETAAKLLPKYGRIAECWRTSHWASLNFLIFLLISKYVVWLWPAVAICGCCLPWTIEFAMLPTHFWLWRSWILPWIGIVSGVWQSTSSWADILFHFLHIKLYEDISTPIVLKASWKWDSLAISLKSNWLLNRARAPSRCRRIRLCKPSAFGCSPRLKSQPNTFLGCTKDKGQATWILKNETTPLLFSLWMVLSIFAHIANSWADTVLDGFKSPGAMNVACTGFNGSFNIIGAIHFFPVVWVVSQEIHPHKPVTSSYIQLLYSKVPNSGCPAGPARTSTHVNVACRLLRHPTAEHHHQASSPQPGTTLGEYPPLVILKKRQSAAAEVPRICAWNMQTTWMYTTRAHTHIYI